MISEAQLNAQQIHANLEHNLHQADIPFSEELFMGMSVETGQVMLDVLNFDTAALSYVLGEADIVREDAIKADSPRRNALIAEFVAYEPFRHVGIIKKAIEMRKNIQGQESLDDERFNEMSIYHLSAARQATETFIAYSKVENPTLMWNYFERMVEQLHEDLNKHQDNQEFVNYVIEDISLYKELQDRIQFNK